jgi:hypothetical protein
MKDARLSPDQTARWVEVCYCPTPLQEERPYWEEFFDLTTVQDAHDRRRCRDQNGSEPLGVWRLRLHCEAGAEAQRIRAILPGSLARCTIVVKHDS